MKIAVIGCGGIANAAHFPTFANIEDIEVKYVVDLVLRRAQAACEKLRAKKAITDYKEVLSDSEVEAVYVLTPNYSHYTITMDCLRANKHVFCEKPITVSYKLAKEMQDLANQKGLILNIGVCNRFHKSVEIIKEMYDSGKLGELYHIYCSFRHYRSIPGLGGAFTTKEKSGGGVLIDWGVHFLDLIMYIVEGNAKTVSANCYSKLGKDIADYKFIDMWAGPPVTDGVNDVEEFVGGFIRTDKAGITLNGAWAQNINIPEMYVDFLGTKGGVRLNYGSKFTLYTEKDGVLVDISPSYNIPDMYEQENRAFIESIKTGVKNKANIDYVIETARIMDAIYESSEKGCEIVL